MGGHSFNLTHNKGRVRDHGAYSQSANERTAPKPDYILICRRPYFMWLRFAQRSMRNRDVPAIRARSNRESRFDPRRPRWKAQSHTITLPGTLSAEQFQSRRGIKSRVPNRRVAEATF